MRDSTTPRYRLLLLCSRVLFSAYHFLPFNWIGNLHLKVARATLIEGGTILAMQLDRRTLTAGETTTTSERGAQQ
jgi:hypothetical protein